MLDDHCLQPHEPLAILYSQQCSAHFHGAPSSSRESSLTRPLTAKHVCALFNQGRAMHIMKACWHESILASTAMLLAYQQQSQVCKPFSVLQTTIPISLSSLSCKQKLAMMKGELWLLATSATVMNNVKGMSDLPQLSSNTLIECH